MPVSPLAMTNKVCYQNSVSRRFVTRKKVGMKAAIRVLIKRSGIEEYEYE